MKKSDIFKTVGLELVGIAVGLVADSIVKRVKNQKKKEDLDNTLVADLTVAELREILKEET